MSNYYGGETRGMGGGYGMGRGVGRGYGPQSGGGQGYPMRGGRGGGGEGMYPQQHGPPAMGMRG